MTLEEVWNKSLSKIEDKVGSNIVELWFRPIRLSQAKEQLATMDIPNRFFKDWIEDNYPDIIAESIESVLGYPVTVRYRTAEKTDPDVKKMDMRLESRRQRLASRGIHLNPKNTFENFIIGPSNQFAQAAAKAVAEAPGRAYNPLFVYGGVGLGKTHLINAVGNAVIDKSPDIIVLYVSAEQFTKEVGAVTDRLRSRFSMGLIADIQLPELETKVAIILKKAEMEKIKVSGDVAYYLASKVKSNIRELEGCLIRLGAQASLTGMPIDKEMAKNVLRDLIEEEDKPVTTDHIQRIVCEHFALKLADMKAKRRTKEVALPRQVAMYLSRQLTNISLNDIGKGFGGKDHATVIYACKQIEDKRARDEAFNRMIENLLQKIKA